MKLIETHIVSKGIPATRLSDYLPGRLKSLSSRKGIKKAIKKGVIFVDSKPGHTGDWVQAGQQIEVFEPAITPPRPLDLSIEIVYEDDYLLLINKPAGLAVSGNSYYTVTNAIQGLTKPPNLPDALPWPFPVHRLDAPTCGLLLLAKSKNAQVTLGHFFEQRKISKTYQALVCGRTESKGTIDFPLDGKEAATTYETLKQTRSLKCEWISWLLLHPITGRTHQLRRHLSESGFPILGDKLYTPSEKPLLRQKGLFLCATHLEFPHPVTHKHTVVSISPPEKFELLFQRNKTRWEKFR